MFGMPPLPGDEVWPPLEWSAIGQVQPPVGAPLVPPLEPEPPVINMPVDDLSLPQPEVEAAPAPEPVAAPPVGMPPLVEPTFEEAMGAPPAPAPPSGLAPAPWDEAPPPSPDEEMNFEPDDFADDPMQADEVERQMALSPEDFAAESEKRAIERERAVAEARSAALLRDEQQADENYRTYRQGKEAAAREMAAIQSDLQALGEQGIDNDRWFRTRDTGQKTAAYVGALLGGLLGNDDAIKMVRGAIDADIDSQKADLAHQRGILGERRGLVADLYAQNGDDFRAAETARLAAYQNLDARLAAQAAALDPRGTSAQRIVQARMGVRSAIAEQTRKLEIETEDRQIKLAQEQRAIEKHRRDMRPKGAAKPSLGDLLKMRELGVRLDASGQLVDDPRGPITKPLSPSDQRAENALIVKDPITGKELAKADNEKAATAAAEAQKAWHNVEQNLKRMRVLRKEIGTTVGLGGVGRIFRGAENDARVAEYDALASQTATLIAKADDPTSTVRDNEKEAVIKDRLPMYETVLGEGAEAAEARDKAALATVRGAVKRAMAAANVKDFDPASYYDDAPKPGETKTQTAARVANMAPAPKGKAIRTPDTYDPVTKKTIPGKNIGTVPLFDHERQVTLAVAELARAAQGGDAAALQHLQVIAADPKHPGSGLAQGYLSSGGR